MKNVLFTVTVCLLASAVLCATTPASTNGTTTATAPTKNTTVTTIAPNTTVTTMAPNTTVTTMAPNTTVTTTMAPNTTVTTMAPNTTVTTTIKPTPAPEDSYELMENKTVCFKAKMSVEFEVMYAMTDKKMGKAVLAIPKGAKYTGSCASEFVAEPTLIVEFDGYKAEFKFSQMGGVVYLGSVSLNYTEDKAMFPNASDPTTAQHAENDNSSLKLSKNDTFFQCISPISSKVDGNVSVMFADLKVQAFSVNGNFSGDGEICDADKKSTSTPMTSTATPTPTPTLPPVPPAGNWSVKGTDGKECIKATMGARFEIPYKTKDNKTAKAKFDVPDSAKTTGSSCGNTTNSDIFQLDFFKDFVLKMIFTTKSSKSLLSAENDYHLQNISLTYFLTEEQFPNAQGDPKKAMMLSNNDEHFNVQVGKSYKCNSKVGIDMGNNATLDTYNLQVQAFKTSNGTEFDTSSECTADNATSNIVPIAVGAALAALVVIVLIAYVIGRRRSRSGYESV